jgi:hypothetical protein
MEASGGRKMGFSHMESVFSDITGAVRMAGPELVEVTK